MAKLPTYALSSPTSDIEGRITFDLSNEGTSTQGMMTNFPPSIDFRVRKIGLPPVENPNYNDLAEEVLKELNKELAFYELPSDLEYNLNNPSAILYKFSSRIIDSPTLTPLSGVNVSNNVDEKKVTSNDKGEFTTNGWYVPGEPLDLTFDTQDYSERTISIVTLSGKIRKDLPTIKLTPLQEGVEEDKLDALGYTKEQKDLLFKNIDKDFISTISKKILNQIKKILIPAILALIAQFGISKISELKAKGKEKFGDLNATCPPNIDALNNIIKKKNQLTKQLNNIYKAIESITKALNIPKTLVDTIKSSLPPVETSFNILSYIPSTAATPIPVGPTLTLFKIIDFLKKLIKVSGSKINQGTLQLNFILEELKKVLNLLNLLDTLVQGCAQEIGGEDGDALTQTQVSDELIASTQDQSNQLSPVVTNVNGFDMGVETEITDNPLKRRRAIAKNTEGVTVLTGEYSYSSNDQILIDELVFYIQQNDLKAE